MLSRRAFLAIAAAASVPAADGWVRLFDGETLKGWTVTPYSGGGQVSVRDGVLVLGKGRTTGVHWTGGELPKSGYEIRFEAARMEGNDYFACLLFPVGSSYCTWVAGGWDGTVVGLSNVDGYDASENDTSANRDFVKGRWYSFRLRVTAEKIEGWIDEQLLVEVDLTKRQVGLRFDDSDLAKPLGFSSYATTGALRNIEYRRI